jgi:hypothetical protein
LQSYSPPPIWIARKIPFLCKIIAKSFMDPEIEWLCNPECFWHRYTWVMHNTLGYHSNWIVSLPLTTFCFLVSLPLCFGSAFVFYINIDFSFFVASVFFSILARFLSLVWWISDCTIYLYEFSFWWDMLFNSYYHGYSLTFCDLVIPFPILVVILFIVILLLPLPFLVTKLNPDNLA